MQVLFSYGIVLLHVHEDWVRFELVNPRKLLKAFDGGYPVLENLVKLGGNFYIRKGDRSSLVSRRDMFVNIHAAEHSLQKSVLASLDKKADEEFTLLRREVEALINHHVFKDKQK